MKADVRTEVFHDHGQIEGWAESIIIEVTGTQPDRAAFLGDCCGIYVGPDRQLVRQGERVEAVIGDGVVTFRPAGPSTV